MGFRNHLTVFALCAIIVLTGFELSSFINSTGAASIDCASATSGFVQIRSGYLCLNDQRFQALGVNKASITETYLGYSRKVNDTVLVVTAGTANLRTLRFAMDHGGNLSYSVYANPPDHSTYFAGIDRLLTDANSRNILLAPEITANPAFWSSMANNTDFFQVGSQANQFFKTTWVAPVVSYYKNSKGIAWWELGSEFDCTCTPGASAPLSEKISWATDMAAFVKNIDPNHLLSGGWLGYVGYKANTNNLDFSLLDARNTMVDIVSLHTYCSSTDQSPSSTTACTNGGLSPVYSVTGIPHDYRSVTFYYVQQVTAHVHDTGKAMLFGEFGSNLISDPPGIWYQWMMNASYTYGTDALEAWSWDEDPPVNGTCGIYHISPQCTPTLVQAMTYWSETMSGLSIPPPGPPSADFAVYAASPGMVDTGQSARSTITVTGQNGFTGSVNLTDAVPSGLSCGKITPSSLTGSGMASVSCNSSRASTYTLNITGTSGGIVHSTTATFTILDSSGPPSGGGCLICILPSGVPVIVWLIILVALMGIVSSVAIHTLRGLFAARSRFKASIFPA